MRLLWVARIRGLLGFDGLELDEMTTLLVDDKIIYPTRISGGELSDVVIMIE